VVEVEHGEGAFVADAAVEEAAFEQGVPAVPGALDLGHALGGVDDASDIEVVGWDAGIEFGDPPGQAQDPKEVGAMGAP
jgi:hypothetical protein